MSSPDGFGAAPGGPGSGPEAPRRSTALIVSVVAATVAVLAVVAVAVWNFVIDPVEAVPQPGPTPTVTGVPLPDPPSGTIDLPPPIDPAPSTTEVPPPPEPPPTTEAPPPPPPPAAFPAGAQPCPVLYPAYGGYERSAAGNGQTSCPFAEEVRLAYSQQPDREHTVVVRAFSPVTGDLYTMTCQPGRLVTCRGGNNAVVHII